MFTDQEMGALKNIVDSAHEMNEECPAANSIESALTMVYVNQPLYTGIKLIAIVAKNAMSLPQGPGPALDWIASVSARIASERRGG